MDSKEREASKLVKDVVFKTVGELINAIGFLAERLDENHTYNKRNKMVKLKGETKLYKLINSNYKLDSKVLNSSVDISKLKNWFKERNLPFSVHELKNGNKEFIFRVNDQKLATKGFKFLLDELTKWPERFANAVLKNPTKMTLDERIEHAKQVQKSYKKVKGNIKQKSKTNVKAVKRGTR